MSFKTISAATSKATLLEKKGQSLEGYLVAVQTGIGKYKSCIYHIETTGGVVKVWGNATFDSALLDEKGKAIDDRFQNVLTRLTCVDVRQVKKGKAVKVYRDFKVEVDLMKKRDSKAKDYVLKPFKKFKK